ncbi:MAG: hypothetical protein ABW042_00970 [Phenylobacterium sp.]
MKKLIAIGTGIMFSLALATSSQGAGFEEKMGSCLSKHANTKDAASVVLECTAGGGKLSGCSVVSSSVNGKGFDKAALCVADVLPIGAKTGVVKVPVRFPGS